MARSAFIVPHTQRLDLEGDWEGEWVEIKEHLGVADQKRIESSAIPSLKNLNESLSGDSPEAGLDLGRMYLTRLKVYLLDWSFRDANGKTVEVSPAAINSLDPDCAEAINRALDAFLKERDKEREANPTGARSSGEARSA